ncbi:MAG: Eukaryotic translation initiation factor 3 subunit E [Marteilia pararefringens]
MFPDDFKSRKQFLIQLAKDLVEWCQNNDNKQPKLEKSRPTGRGRCQKCDWKADKKTTIRCDSCKILLCKDHNANRDTKLHKSLLKLKIDISLKKSRMPDLAIETYQKLYDRPASDELIDFKENLIKEIEQINKNTQYLNDFFMNPHLREITHNEEIDVEEKQIALSKKYDNLIENADKYLARSEFLFSIGNDYQTVLSDLKVLQSFTTQKFYSNYLAVLWGCLNASILTQDFNFSLKILKELQNSILNEGSDLNLNDLKNLLTTSLFVYFKSPEGIVPMIDNFLSNPNIQNALISCCPYLVKYLIVALIINVQDFSQYQSKLLELIQNVRHLYTDPFVALISALYLDFDVHIVPLFIIRSLKVMKSNYFFADYCDVFHNNAGMLYVFSYCKIHNSVNFNTLSRYLELPEVQLKQHIKHLIEKGHLKARANEEENMLESLCHRDNEACSDKSRLISRMRNLIERSEALNTTDGMLLHNQHEDPAEMQA